MVRLTDRPDMTLDVYRGRKTTPQQQQRLVKTVPMRGSQHMDSMRNTKKIVETVQMRGHNIWF